MKKLPNRIIVIFIFVLTCIIFISCENNNSGKSISKSKNELNNPLDKILGDKILNIETNDIRKNNFDSLIGINKNNFESESKLYNIKKIDPNHFILSQKKNFSEARNFNILLKTNDKKIIDFVVFNDFNISDIKHDSTSWLLLLSDFNQNNKYWLSQQQIQILKLDENFNEQWKYTKKCSIPLNGESVRVSNNQYSVIFEIITGCHICYSIAEMTLSKEGEFISVKSVGSHNSNGLTDLEIADIISEK